MVIGEKVTVGHNVRLGACTIGDNCLIGMGCTIEDDAVIEEDAFVGARAIVKAGTVVKANTIFAGRPANYFRDVKNEEANFFKMGQKVYEGFAEDYIKELGSYKMQAKVNVVYDVNKIISNSGRSNNIENSFSYISKRF